MLRKVIKCGAAEILHRTGADRLIGACSAKKHAPLVIGYHRVVEDFRASAKRSIPSMLISVEMFARHLDWIGRRHEFVTLDDIAAWAHGMKQFRRPVAALTFDDGYADVYRHAFPVLRRKGVPAAVFVVTDLVETPRMQIHDELYLRLSEGFSIWRSPGQRLGDLLCGLGADGRLQQWMERAAGAPFSAMRALLENVSQGGLERINEALRAEVAVSPQDVHDHRTLSWGMLKEMQQSGMTVGSHTRTHAYLDRAPRDKAISETRDSKRAAEQRLGCRIDHFAYPDGRFDAAAVKAVAEAGYRSAYTTCDHRDPAHPALTIPRRLWWENSCVGAGGEFSPAVMSCQVNGVFDRAGRCRRDHAE